MSNETIDLSLESKQVTPEDFDFDAWIDGAKRTQRSVKVYKRADVLAELDELERQIKVLEDAGEEESLNSELGKLQNKWRIAAQSFKDSAKLFTVQALTNDEIIEISEKSRADDVSAEELGYRLLSASLVEPKLSVAQLRRMTSVIGEMQTKALFDAQRAATYDAPVISVPFSLMSSAHDAGDM